MRAGHLLALVQLLGGAELGPLGMTEAGVVVEAHLGVEGVHSAVGPEDERVDLGEVAVARREAAVELHQHVGGAVDRRWVELGVDARLAGDGWREAVDRVDVQHHDRRRVLLGHDLDLDATLGREHEQVVLRRAVEAERRVVLLGDVGRVLHPDALHEVALDVHAEDVPGVRAHLVGVVGELDATRLPASADLHLGLHDHRVARLVGLNHGLVDRHRHAARRHGDAVPGEVLLALVFEQVHAVSLSASIV